MQNEKGFLFLFYKWHLHTQEESVILYLFLNILEIPRMTEHFRLLSAVINLVIGTWMAFFFYQKTRSRGIPALKYIVHLVICFDLVLFIYLIVKYFSLNLLETLPVPSHTPLNIISLIAVTSLLYGILGSVIRLFYSLRHESIPKILIFWFIFGYSVLLLGFGIRLVFLPQSHDFVWLDVFQGVSYIILFLFDVILPIRMIRYARRSVTKDTADLIGGFGKLYLSRLIFLSGLYLFFGLIFWWHIPENIAPFIAFVALLYLNLVPLFWYRFFFIGYANRMVKLIEDPSVLQRIAEDHHISQREQEIMQLLLDGKSNKEIEKSLFISYHTVKNHVYNLYQKLGIKSRYELLHLITKYEKEHLNDA